MLTGLYFYNKIYLPIFFKFFIKDLYNLFHFEYNTTIEHGPIINGKSFDKILVFN